MLPTNHDIEPVSKQLTIIIGLTVVGFMAFGLALSFYRNILFEETLKDMELRNHDIAKSIDQGYRDLEYYRSDQYKDKYAKENLNRITPDERVLLIHEAAASATNPSGQEAANQEQRQAAYFELLRQMPVIEHWKLYFFHHDKLEEFKKELGG